MIARKEPGHDRLAETPDEHPAETPDEHRADAPDDVRSRTRGSAGEFDRAASVDPPPDRAGRPLSKTLQSAFLHVVEGTESVHALLQVRADRTRIAVRRSVMIAIASILAAAALAPLILGGAVLFTIGVSQSMTHWLGDRAWLGNLVGGALILGLVAAFAWAAYARVVRRDFAKKLAKYQRMQRERESRSGRSEEPASKSSTAPERV
jgi:hypothetical protein